MKSLAKQLAQLEKAAEALPAIQTEIRRIEASVSKLNQFLGGRPAAKRGRPAKVAPKITRRRQAKARTGLKEKVLAALAKGPLAAAHLKKLDGRAVPRTLDKWVSLGILKKEPKGLYSRP
jgi:type II secretory pathway component HofQ